MKMIRGYDQSLYILPFDHRHSYITGVFHWREPLTPEQVADISASKQVIYDGFKAAVVADRGLHGRAGILVDERFGSTILRDAADQGYVTCVSTERSGQEEFDFEYGEDFAAHIESVNPTFAKVLVRYNPESDPAMNRRQADRLRRFPTISRGPNGCSCSSCSFRRHAHNSSAWAMLVQPTTARCVQR
jgi:myo-inositol catabolism protein IolC